MTKSKSTKHGTGVSHARNCKVQASWKRLGVSDPVPFTPAKPLRTRGGIYLKYFFPTVHTGTFWVRGDAMPGVGPAPGGGAATAYPIFGETGQAFTRKNRRQKQIFLPVVGKVRVFLLIDGNDELASTLEFE